MPASTSIKHLLKQDEIVKLGASNQLFLQFSRTSSAHFLAKITEIDSAQV